MTEIDFSNHENFIHDLKCNLDSSLEKSQKTLNCICTSLQKMICIFDENIARQDNINKISSRNRGRDESRN